MSQQAAHHLPRQPIPIHRQGDNMNRHLIPFICLAVLSFCGCRCMDCGQGTCKPLTEEQRMSMQKTYDFIKAAGHYFIATVDNDQPRVRPFGTIHIFEGKLYIQTGRRKNVAKQLMANGKTEICAMKGDEWIRVSGELVDDPRREAKASMLDEYESLKKMYSADDENTMVLYFKPGTVTATIYSFKGAPVAMEF